MITDNDTAGDVKKIVYTMYDGYLGIDETNQNNKPRIAIIGLGYVGLPLAAELARHYHVVGFDIDECRVDELSRGYDSTLETQSSILLSVIKANRDSYSTGLFLSRQIEDLQHCNTYIITVPTHIDEFNRPDLSLLLDASKTAGTVLERGDIVIYESTVYPGATEEECVPVLEKVSGLKFNTDFFVGYSPERINPGDKEHTIPNVVKITSGSTLETANFVDALYRSIVKAGTCKVTSIKVAEAAKVIENAQRDVNIAFVNELAKMFNRMHISTNEVLEAAGTKWNFFKFKPGLVGGHCVSVDPYYLAQKAQNSGYYPELIVTARKLNNSMGEYVARQVIQAMIGKEINPKNAKILVLGVTFKENCADVRNTKIVDIVDTLKEYHASVTICDPLADPNKLMREYGLKSIREVSGLKDFDAVILAVAHREFAAIDIPSLCKSKRVIYDVKNLLPNEIVDARL